MKILLIVLSMLLINPIVFAEDIKSKIERFEQECLAKDFTTIGMNKCIDLSIKSWEQEIEKKL